MWSGGAGLGTWTQNADPALATFTPSTASGSFTATLTLTGRNGCSNDADTRTITWGTQPVATAGSIITTCTGTAAITMTGATATGTYSGTPTWSGGAGLGTWTQNADPALATFTPSTASGSFTATLTLTGTNGCSNDADTRTITWGTQPVATAGSIITTCTGTATITMTGATATGTYSGTPTWSGGAGIWAQNANPALATFTPSTASGSFTATLTLTGANGCNNATDIRTITWGTQPVASAGTDITTCTGTSAIAMTDATATGTYSGTPTWSGGAGTWAQNANPALATFTPSTASGSFTATLTLTGANGCSNATDTRTITWETQPVATATPSSQTICNGATTNIALTSNVAGTTFTWTAAQLSGAAITGFSNGLGNTIAQILSNANTTSGVVRYTITPTASGCTGNNITVDVTVNPTPNVIATPSSQTICSATASSIALTSNVAGTTFAWTVVQSGVSGATNASGSTIAQTLTATGLTAGTATYTITPTASGCPGASIDVTITVNPRPTGSASPQTVCSGSTTSVALNSNIAGTTFTWTAAIQTTPTGGTITGQGLCASSCGTTIAQTLTNTGTTFGVIRYTVTPTASGCAGTPFTVDVTVNPTPNVTATPSSQTICSGTASSIVLTSNVAGTTFAWTVIQSGVSGATAVSGSSIAQTLTATGATAGTATYTITPTANGFPVLRSSNCNC